MDVGAHKGASTFEAYAIGGKSIAWSGQCCFLGLLLLVPIERGKQRRPAGTGDGSCSGRWVPVFATASVSGREIKARGAMEGNRRSIVRGTSTPGASRRMPRIRTLSGLVLSLSTSVSRV